MNITSLVERCMKESTEKYGKDDSIVKMCKNCMTFFGYKVLEEINGLNFPAFTILDSFNRSKRGFVNALLNYLIDKDDEKYGKIHFDEYEDWKEYKKYYETEKSNPVNMMKNLSEILRRTK